MPRNNRSGTHRLAARMVKRGHGFYPQQSQFMLTWTNDADLLVVNAEGPDLASLYAWWLSAR